MNKLVFCVLALVASVAGAADLRTADFDSELMSQEYLDGYLQDSVPVLVEQAVRNLPIFEGIDSDTAFVKTVGGSAYGLKVADAVTRVVVSSNISVKYTIPEDPAGVNEDGYYYRYAAYCGFSAYIRFDIGSFGSFVDSTTNNVGGTEIPVRMTWIETDTTKVYSIDGVLRSWVLTADRTIRMHNPTNTTYGTRTWNTGDVVWGLCNKGQSTLRNLSDTGMRNYKNSNGYGFYFVVVPGYSNVVDQTTGTVTKRYTGEQTWLDILSGSQFSRTGIGLTVYLAKNNNNTWSTPDSSLSDASNYKGGATDHSNSEASGSSDTIETLVPTGVKVPVLTELNITNTPINSIVLTDGTYNYKVFISNGVLSTELVQ